MCNYKHFKLETETGLTSFAPVMTGIVKKVFL